ncbi:ribosomal protection-like ABC-F family protein [Paenibacillus paeoniae]|uniref:ABC transporter ATP-binding protein n=1 Tax=Paenibacillus paeoniae TaxID=2292705 RepID=A0A371PPF0_9BACL|nr:ABC-F family ATP-binding cassette domain-containing protein [Paenibacillus paeoniae]REK77579.1 ABC transporter ATP-binding protein [Paenibacillus paeoniae]
MIIVQVQNVKKYHAANLVLENITFQLKEGGKVALIGRNGSGKSTLLRLIAGHDGADEGVLTIKKGLRIGYLPQIPAEFERLTVYEVLAFGYRELLAIREEMAELEKAMSSSEALAQPGKLEHLLAAYAKLQEKFEQGGGYEMETNIDQVAAGLQIDRSQDSRIFGSLSGGEKTRIVLASQLVVRPELLLLDEPTNHLDLKGIEWLEQFLNRYEGAYVIVSHDRYFLDAVTTETIEVEDGESQLYLASYSGYVKEKEARLLQQFAQFQEQQKVIKKMKETIRQLEEWGRIGDNGKFFKRAASIRKALERMEKIKRPVLERKTAEFELSPQDRSARRVLEFSGVRKQYGDRVILSEAEGSLLYGEKVALLGDNGAGKTTLLKLVLGTESPDAGDMTIGSRVDIGYLAQQEARVNPKQTVLEYFRIEDGLEEGEARNVLAHYLFYGNDVFKPLSSLSGGEWSRLRLALLVRRKPNLLLLDEPTNHLDIDSREALEEALEEFPGTILAISHDRYFMNRLAKRIWELEQGRIVSYLGDYNRFKEKRMERTTVELPLGNKEGGTASSGKQIGAASRSAAERQPQKSVGQDGRTKNGEQLREQLESEIANLEQQLKAIDGELMERSESGNMELLEQGWSEREALEAKLSALMEKWMEHSS